jgi:23S rRNA (adenine2503-C2)-methyltransferase
MRKITTTHTGIIVSDTDMELEYLYVGDYGKENNIKADFLGYTKKIKKVEHRPVDITDKLVVTVSTQKGCLEKCKFCDCPKYGFKGNVPYFQLMSEIINGVALSKIQQGQRLNVHFARMGEPTWNPDVISVARDIGTIMNGAQKFIEYHPVVSTMLPKNNKKLIQFLHAWCELGNMNLWNGGIGLQFSINTLDEADRNDMFNNCSLSLAEISEIGKQLPMPTGRKYTLNFAVTGKCNLDPEIMGRYFDKDKFLVKITPIHATEEAIKNDFATEFDFDVYEKFERPLVEAGWDVIVFIPSFEEDSDRITCGNSLIALGAADEGSAG